MPQLDKLVMISQFFWLVIFFLGLYFILLKDILPRILRIKILRKILNVQGINNYKQAKESYDRGKIRHPWEAWELSYILWLPDHRWYLTYIRYLGPSATFLLRILGFGFLERNGREMFYNNLRFSAWNYYFNIRDIIFHYDEASKLNLKSIVTWILSKDVIEKVWSKEVNFYGLKNIASHYNMNFKNYNVASSFIAKL